MGKDPDAGKDGRQKKGAAEEQTHVDIFESSKLEFSYVGDLLYSLFQYLQ